MSENTKQDGGPAFPTVVTNTSSAAIVGLEGEFVPSGSRAEYSGMTLRDYFAAKALGGLIGGRSWGEQMTPDELTTTWANAAYGVADKMLAARNQTNTKE
jgi:hypothetical protein